MAESWEKGKKLVEDKTGPIRDKVEMKRLRAIFNQYECLFCITSNTSTRVACDDLKSAGSLQAS